MPQGKGTYGSKVGRPPKKGKKKYQDGGNVDPFSTRNPEGVPSEQLEEAMEDQNMANKGIPTSNAMDRSETYQLGGPVRPPTAPGITPTPQYKKGGKVKKTVKKVFTGEKNITDVIKAVEKKRKKERAEWKEHTIFGPQFKKDVS